MSCFHGHGMDINACKFSFRTTASYDGGGVSGYSSIPTIQVSEFVEGNGIAFSSLSKVSLLFEYSGRLS
ncbi:hypothetical protein T4D_5326 [Trichinella pseudospiralis]|uniref:Uncharacterized protein n=1 Tax=Trichinella pseudospiralis TaxID=6337 RepID=A0A0V1FII7_TRIPS|nr:hypothetical protein T4D_5326 [Trichinella pseudospiralis]